MKGILLVASAALILGLSASPAKAEEHWHHEFHDRDVHHFHDRDMEVWRGGHWHHEWHDGRFGWWWFAGGVWYWYDRPAWPYPDIVSETTIIEPMAAPPPAGVAPAPTYYYCDRPAGYYPYVQNCQVPFRPVPAAPPPQ